MSCRIRDDDRLVGPVPEVACVIRLPSPSSRGFVGAREVALAILRRPDRLHADLLRRVRGGRACGQSEPGFLVCVAEETTLESTELGIRAGLDGALYRHGGLRMADLEESIRPASVHPDCLVVVRVPARVERGMVLGLLRMETARVGAGGNPAPLARDRDDDVLGVARFSTRRPAVTPLSRLGELRLGPERSHLASESLIQHQ